jgi:hypothetical protein
MPSSFSFFHDVSLLLRYDGLLWSSSAFRRWSGIVSGIALGTAVFAMSGLGNNDRFAWIATQWPFQTSDSSEEVCGSPRGTHDAMLASHIHGHHLRSASPSATSPPATVLARHGVQGRLGTPVGVGISRTGGFERGGPGVCGVVIIPDEFSALIKFKRVSPIHLLCRADAPRRETLATLVYAPAAKTKLPSPGPTCIITALFELLTQCTIVDSLEWAWPSWWVPKCHRCIQTAFHSILIHPHTHTCKGGIVCIMERTKPLWREPQLPLRGFKIPTCSVVK